METSLKWEQLHELLLKRIESIEVEKGEKIEIINANSGSQASFLSIRMCQEAGIALSPAFLAKEVIAKLTEEGKNQESERKTQKMEETLRSFLEQMKVMIDQITKEILQEVEKKLTGVLEKSSFILDFFHEFTDGNLNNDKKLLERLEEVLVMNSRATKQAGTKRTLSFIQAKLHHLLMNLQENLKRELETSSLLKDNQMFSSITRLVPQASLKSPDWPENPSAIGSSSTSEDIAFCTQDNFLISRNVLSQKDNFKVKLEKHSIFASVASIVQCKFSPNNQTIAVITEDRKLTFFEGKSGETLKTFSNIGLSSSTSFCWVDNNDVCVGFSDGTIKIFSYFSPQETHFYPFGTCTICALEKNDATSVFLLSSIGSLALVNLSLKVIQWNYENCIAPDFHDFNSPNFHRSYDGSKLVAFGGSDGHIELLEPLKNDKKWSKGFGGKVVEAIWVPGDQFIIAAVSKRKPADFNLETFPYLIFTHDSIDIQGKFGHSHEQERGSSKIIVVSPNSGSLLYEFNDLDFEIKFFVLNLSSRSILAGNLKQKGQLLKIES